jgi:hypothetical protein
LAEEQLGLHPEQPMDPASGNVIPFDQVGIMSVPPNMKP